MITLYHFFPVTHASVYTLRWIPQHGITELISREDVSHARADARAHRRPFLPERPRPVSGRAARRLRARPRRQARGASDQRDLGRPGRWLDPAAPVHGGDIPQPPAPLVAPRPGAR